MVNLGPSKGCHTCRTRRIKCDEGAPECQRCLRSRRVCGGYVKKPTAYKFRNQTTKFVAVPDVQGHAHTHERHELRQIAPAQENVAVCFFVKNFATLGRDLASTRGFWELIPPILSSEQPGSPLSLAITAISMRIWHLWSAPGDHHQQDVVQAHSSRALNRLGQAVSDPAESSRTATILACMTLQLDENISSLRRARKPSRVHHEGAMALAKHQAANPGQTGTSGNYALFHLLYNEVLFAFREQKPVCSELLEILTRRSNSQNASVKLNLVGASIANLQWRLSLSTREAPFIQPLLDVYYDAQSIQAELLSWRDWIPDEWHPVKLAKVKHIEPAVSTYHEHCDVYLSVQIASLWNSWRCYYLTLLKIIIATDPQSNEAYLFPEHEAACVQQLVDDICDSIPFYLGNCTGKLCISDVSKSSIYFPSFHDLDQKPQPRPWCGQTWNSMSAEEHTRHVLAQGAWHVLMPLLHLLDLLADGDGLGLGVFLRAGQWEWIKEQTARAQVMLDAQED